MKVRISDISQNGLPIKDTLSLESINERMAQGRGNDIVFTEAPFVDVVLTKTGMDAELKGTVKSKYTQPCSLCLDVCEREVQVKAKFILKPRPLDNTAPADDIGIVYFDGDHADLQPVLEETLILTLDIFWHPPFDSNDSCTHCHKTRKSLNLAAEEKIATFGDILKTKLNLN